MVKLTKRKGFNFFRSYFDVYNLLIEDKDKIQFIEALLNRQFLGVKPTDLKGLAEFAYVSQTNSIDSQVKGYEDKTKTKLNPLEEKVLPPCYGVVLPPTLQVEEKVEEKLQYLYSQKDFLEDWNLARTHFTGMQSNFNKLKQDEQTDFKLSLNNFTKEDIQDSMKGLFIQEHVPQDIMKFRPKHFLKNIDTYLDAFKNKKKNLYKE